MHWLQLLWHWLEVHTGTINESGPYYGFWSGFGSDIGEAAIVGGLWMGFKKLNCHVKRCPRMGHFGIDGTPYKVCRKHHPDVPDEGPTHAHMLRMHRTHGR
jgi:hypothetical protein